MSSAVTEYVRELHHMRHGTAELARYTPLINLLNEIGRSLRPKVRAEGNLRNMGAGHPDVGLFTEQQAAEQLPERGVLEVKAPDAALQAIARSDQVQEQYLPLYGQVLVTNYWSFVLVSRDERGQAALLEAFSLAEDEAAFWQAAA